VDEDEESRRRDEEVLENAAEKGTSSVVPEIRFLSDVFCFGGGTIYAETDEE
jgi:hypothetical protein